VEVRELFLVWFVRIVYTLEPTLNNWLKNKPEAAEIYPPTCNFFSKQWAFDAMHYYTLEKFRLN
jgi:hypothetical protein